MLETGIKIVARRLANRMGIKDLINHLQRTEDVTRGASEARHIQTIKLFNPHQFEKKSVLLLDDVTTTGSTLAAGEKIILRARPSILYSLALAKTLSAAAP